MLIPLFLIAAAAAAPAGEQAVAEPAAPERGVISYPPSFFAEVQPVSAFDMVTRLPGFTFDKGVSVRGLAGGSGNVLIDGQPAVSKNDTLDEVLKRVPAASVERIELIRGGAPGIEMDGRSIVANVVRKQAAGFRGAITPSATFIYDGRVLSGLRAEAQWRWPGGRAAELSQIFGMRVFDEYGDGYRVRYNADETVRLRSSIDADGGGRSFWTTGAYETPLAGGKARVNAAYMTNPYASELYDRYVGGGREYEYITFGRDQIELGGRYSRTLTQRLSLEAVVLRQNTRGLSTVHFEAPGLVRDFDLRRKGAESVGRLILKLRASQGLSLEASAEGALNRLDSRTTLATNGVAVVVPAANVEIEEQRGELALRGAWQASDALTLEAGLRVERSTLTSMGDVTLENPQQFTKPRLSAVWSPSASNQVRLRLEREVGQLNFEDFVATSSVASTGTLSAGNPDLTPQQAWVAEATFEQRFWGSGAVVATVRRFELSDVVDRVPVFGPTGAILADAPGNIGDGRRDELQVSLALPLDRLGAKGAHFRGQVTRRWSRVIDPITGARRDISTLRMGTGRDAAVFTPVSWDAHFTQDLPRLHAVWGIDVIGGFRDIAYRLSEIETKKISTQISLFTEYRARPNLTLRVEAVAVNQRDARRIREVYAGPRNLGVIDYTDVRNLEWGGGLNISLRRAFGG
jgi:outer membrane receptor protein involved in Fe transport